MDLGLSGKVALVTGATGGIGRAAAVALAGEGTRTAVTYHSRKEGALQTVAHVEERGGEAMATRLDLSDESTIDDTVAQVLERWGRIDVLVANAVSWDPPSEGAPTLFEDVPPAQWHASISATLFGTLRTVQAVIPSMRAQGWGRIAVVSTGIVQRGAVGEVMYGTAKSALHGMTRSLAREVGPAGVYVNVVMPGLTTTEHSSEIFSEEWHRTALSRTPSARLSTAEDIASAILYVCSAANGNITGETIKVDGGM